MSTIERSLKRPNPWDKYSGDKDFWESMKGEEPEGVLILRGLFIGEMLLAVCLLRQTVHTWVFRVWGIQGFASKICCCLPVAGEVS